MLLVASLTCALFLFAEPSTLARRSMPTKLQHAVTEFESKMGRRVRMRSFTVLRSPLSLVHSQFSHWHAESALPRELFYELSPEMLLFRDAFKLLRGTHREEVCIREDDWRRVGGGIFLDLSLTKTKTENACATPQWRAMCRRLMLALVERLRIPKQKFLPQRHLNCSTARPDATQLAASALSALPANATYEALSVAVEGMCPVAQRNVLQVTRCWVGHAERVRQTLLEIGCDELIRRALSQLGHLSHVLFADATKFSLQHVLEMAQRGREREEDKDPIPQGNVGSSNVPFNEEELAPFNQCSLRFCESSSRSLLSDHDPAPCSLC
jgi:hypothetical protein